MAANPVDRAGGSGQVLGTVAVEDERMTGKERSGIARGKGTGSGCFVHHKGSVLERKESGLEVGERTSWGWEWCSEREDTGWRSWVEGRGTKAGPCLGR